MNKATAPTVGIDENSMSAFGDLVERVGATELTIVAALTLLIPLLCLHLFKTEKGWIKLVAFLPLALVLIVAIWKLLDRPERPQPINSSAESSPSDGNSTSRAQPTTVGRTSNSSQPRGSEQEPLPAATPEAIPPELRSWAEENLGARPDLSPRFERDYPVCVAELRERTATEGVLTDADACARQLREHRRRYVVPLFAERERYADALLSQQRLLTRRAPTPEGQQRLNYLQREDHNFYYDDGAANLRFLAAGRRSKEDLRLCETNGCRVAS